MLDLETEALGGDKRRVVVPVSFTRVRLGVGSSPATGQIGKRILNDQITQCTMNLEWTPRENLAAA